MRGLGNRCSIQLSYGDCLAGDNTLRRRAGDVDLTADPGDKRTQRIRLDLRDEPALDLTLLRRMLRAVARHPWHRGGPGLCESHAAHHEKQDKKQNERLVLNCVKNLAKKMIHITESFHDLRIV